MGLPSKRFSHNSLPVPLVWGETTTSVFAGWYRPVRAL